MRLIIFTAFTAAVLAGLWFVIKPGAPELSATRPIEESARFEFTIRDGQISGPEVMPVQQGQTVHIQVLSDSRDELHLHGYDLHLPLSANTPAHLSFKADRSGRFELELHGSHQGLGNLEVYPAP